MGYGGDYWGLYRDYYRDPFPHSLLGGSWVVISRVISWVTILITHIRGLITLPTTTPEPPNRP